MKIRSIALAAALTLGTAALAGDAISGFSHDNKSDLFGYYLPPDGIKVGHFVLHTFAIGQMDDLKKWETGKERLTTWAPVMVSFTDLTSKTVKNEESGEMEHQDVRVLPTAYRIKGNTVAFVGAMKGIGTVTFTGTLDVPAIAKLNAAAGTENGKSESEGNVLKGDLTVGSQTFKNIGFSWFAGD